VEVPETARPPAAGRGVLAVMFDRRFGPYLLGNLASNCGTWFQNIAQALLIYRLTHSTMLVAVANFSQFIGVLVLAPWAGAAADRFDRRRLLMTVQAASLVVALTLTLTAYAGHAGLPVIMIAALLLGLGTAFATPSLQALVPALVERSDMPTAVAMNTVTFTLARAVGPVLGALAVGHLGIPAAFALNTSSYLVLIGALAVVHPRPMKARSPQQGTTLRETLRLVRGDSVSALMLVLVACVAVSGDPVNTLTPAFATHVFHRPDTTVGVLIGAFGFGSVVAAFVARNRGGHRGMAALMVFMGLGTVALALSTHLAIALLALSVAGFGFLAAQTAATVRLQERVSDAQRGRVMALWSVAWLGTRPIASLIDGALASLAGVRVAAAAMAVPVLVGAALLVVVWRRLPEGAKAGR
jgi:MFS family permease